MTEFLSNFCNSLPGVGHVKSLVHLAFFDLEGAKKAFGQATRTTLICRVGEIGAACLGPIGAGAAAACGGFIIDTVTSVATGKHTGIHKEINGGSAIDVIAYVGGDVLGYLSGGLVSGGVVKNAAQVMIKQVPFLCHSSNRGFHLSNNGSIPAVGNNWPVNNFRDTTNSNNKNVVGQKEIKTFFKEFMKLLKNMLENETTEGQKKKILKQFRNLSPKQKEYLLNLITELKKNGSLNNILEVVIRIFFTAADDSDFTFPNFISMIEFVRAYISDEDRKLQGKNRRSQNFQDREKKLISDYTLQNQIVTAFYKTKHEILIEKKRMCAGDPFFRNMFSAVHHYHKHKFIQYNRLLSVKEYFDLIKRLLQKVILLPEYCELGERRHSRKELVYEEYDVVFGRRIRIVLKLRGNKIVVASCFCLGNKIPGDKEGDVFVDGVRKGLTMKFYFFNNNPKYR